jgi:hypothetical protein
MRNAAGHARLPGRLGLLGVLALTLLAGGCQTDGQATSAFASARGSTIAFESIDGPPQPVFQKLVENLASEAVARQVSVISRESTPAYRVRSYMAAHIENKRIHIGWVWDVYDADRRRVLRITDEEVGRGSAAEAWNAADDAMLRRIARSGMDRIAAFLGTGGAPAPSGAPGGGGVAVAEAPEEAPAVAASEAPAASDARPAATPARAPRRSRQARAEPPALAAAIALADTRN